VDDNGEEGEETHFSDKDIRDWNGEMDAFKALANNPILVNPSSQHLTLLSLSASHAVGRTLHACFQGVPVC